MGIKDKVRVGSQPHLKLLLVLCPPLRQEEKLDRPTYLINWILYLLYNIEGQKTASTLNQSNHQEEFTWGSIKPNSFPFWLSRVKTAMGIKLTQGELAYCYGSSFCGL